MSAPSCLRDDTPQPWLDAPTCEGWWWFKDDLGYAPCVVHITKGFDGFVYYKAGYDDPGTVSKRPGRWFGPLVPPEG